MAAENYQILFDFGKTDAANEWQTVNDGVMGGISDSQINITSEKTMEFFGTLSLENNGGFTSMRSTPKNLNFKKGDTLVVRARGDGREYSLNLYTQRRLTAFSYRAMFTTKENEWIEVHIPMDRFVATSFGQTVKDQPLDPKEVNSLGILLGDKKAGRFKLEIDWIKVIKAK
ncbi:MAG: CIA30 family protein [Acidobacteria bacterium]|nr:CIA30 family protein [Acidobacteriota bacterium]